MRDVKGNSTYLRSEPRCLCRQTASFSTTLNKKLNQTTDTKKQTSHLERCCLIPLFQELTTRQPSLPIDYNMARFFIHIQTMPVTAQMADTTAATTPDDSACI